MINLVVMFCASLLLMHILSVYSSVVEQEERFSRSLMDASHNGKIIDLVQQTIGTVVNAKFESWSMPQQYSEQAIFAVAMATTYIPRDAMIFAGTARRTGFEGDIVVAVLPGANQNFLNKLKDYNCSVYTMPVQCSGRADIRCGFKGATDFPVTLLRNYLYQFWAMKYPSSAFIMTADFRDTIFQSNPFKYKIEDWGPNAFDLTIFLETHPNRVINRTPTVGGFMLNCYGRDVFRQLGSGTVSSNGIVFGRRDALIIYNYLITTQEDVRIRRGASTNATNTNCDSFGVDQAFHNYLYYSGQLSQMMKVKAFQQGEGPVNTVGGFFGKKKILRAALSDWKIIRGESPYKYVHQWNGEISCVVHQLDRFTSSELSGGFAKHLAVFQHMT